MVRDSLTGQLAILIDCCFFSALYFYLMFQCFICSQKVAILWQKICVFRGIKAGISFAFTEVIVGCELEKVEDNREDLDMKQNNIVYLHLKKYFRGTRFANQSFLRTLQSKYEEGNRVCVSGKVRVMNIF